MENLDNQIISIIDKYIESIKDKLKSVNKRYLTLAWHLFINVSESKHRDMQIVNHDVTEILKSIPKDIKSDGFSLNCHLSESDVDTLIKHARSAIDICCRKYNNSPTAYERAIDDPTLIKFIIGAAEITKDSVYIPYLGLGALAVSLPTNSVSLRAVDKNARDLAMAVIRMLIHHDLDCESSCTFVLADAQDDVSQCCRSLQPKNQEGFHGYDVILLTPPLQGNAKAYADFPIIIEECFSLLTDKGRLIVALPSMVIGDRQYKGLLYKKVIRSLSTLICKQSSGSEELLAVLEITRHPNFSIRYIFADDKYLTPEEIDGFLDECRNPYTALTDCIFDVYSDKLNKLRYIPKDLSKICHEQSYDYISLSEWLLPARYSAYWEDAPRVITMDDLSEDAQHCEVNINNLHVYNPTMLSGNYILRRHSGLQPFTEQREVYLLFGFDNSSIKIGRLDMSMCPTDIFLEGHVQAYRLRKNLDVNEYYILSVLKDIYIQKLLLYNCQIPEGMLTQELFLQINIPRRSSDAIAERMNKEVVMGMNPAQKAFVAEKDQQIAQMTNRASGICSLIGSINQQLRTLDTIIDQNQGFVDKRQLIPDSPNDTVADWLTEIMHLTEKAKNRVKELSQITENQNDKIRVLCVSNNFNLPAKLKDDYGNIIDVEARRETSLNSIKKLYEYKAIIIDSSCDYRKVINRYYKDNSSHNVAAYIVYDSFEPLWLLDDMRMLQNEYPGLTVTAFNLSKIEDQRALITEIIRKARQAEEAEFQVRNVHFKDVFDAIAYLNLGSDADHWLLDLLLPMIAPVGVNDYNHRFLDLRRIIESVFIHMHRNGLLCPGLIGYYGKPNLSWTAQALCGNDGKFTSDDMLQYEVNSETCKLYGKAPDEIGKNVKKIIDMCGSNAHADSGFNSYYRSLRSPSSYLIRSYALQLCDFILWYTNYFKGLKSSSLFPED